MEREGGDGRNQISPQHRRPKTCKHNLLEGEQVREERVGQSGKRKRQKRKEKRRGREGGKEESGDKIKERKKIEYVETREVIFSARRR